MSTTRIGVRTAARELAQDNPSMPLLQSDPADYNRCILDALLQFNQDRSKVWTFDYTVAAAGFRFVLSGAGQIMPSSGLNAWIDGGSQVQMLWFPYQSSNQGSEPMDSNHWRLVDDPGPKTVLEFIADQAGVGDVIRLVYSTPHQVHESDTASTSIRTGDVDTFNLLVAATICEQAAIRYAQNTGNTGLQADQVDRRSQSDIMKARARDLRTRYNRLVGRSDKETTSVLPASGVKDLDVGSSHRRGFIWHPTSLR